MGEASRDLSGASDRHAQEREYRKYRARYERLRAELMRRDQRAQSDPFALQRWPLERKAFADRVQQALTEWEIFGHKSDVETRGPVTGKEGRRDGRVDAGDGVEEPPWRRE